MPALAPVPSTIQFKLFFNDHGNSNVQTLLYVSYSSTLAQSDLQTLCNTCFTQWATHMLPNQVPNLSLLGVTGNDLSAVTAPKAASTFPSQAGTNAGSPIPNAANFIISHETARKYRGGHSRSYIMGMPANQLADGNTWTSPWQTTMLTAWNAFLSGLLTTGVPVAVGTLQHVVAHRYGRTKDGTPGTPDSDLPSVPLDKPFTDPVTAEVANPQVGSQRRRNQQAG